jgi:hypothetical protein
MMMSSPKSGKCMALLLEHQPHRATSKTPASAWFQRKCFMLEGDEGEDRETTEA